MGRELGRFPRLPAFLGQRPVAVTAEMRKGGYVRREQDKLRPPKVSQFRSDRLTSLYVYSSRVQRERTLVRQGERRQTRSFRLTWRHRGDEYFTRPLPGDCHLSSGHPLPGSAIAPSPTTPAGLDRALSPGPSPRRWASCPVDWRTLPPLSSARVWVSSLYPPRVFCVLSRRGEHVTWTLSPPQIPCKSPCRCCF
jgi:hypothetical protein